MRCPLRRGQIVRGGLDPYPADETIATQSAEQSRIRAAVAEIPPSR